MDLDRLRRPRSTSFAGASLLRKRLGPYQLQAARAEAASIEDTDWRRILTLQDQLLTLAPTRVVAPNRAIAVGEVEGPAFALALVDALALDGYHPFHATRADLLRRLNRHAEATEAYERAASLAPTTAERDFLARRAREAEES